MTGQNAGVNPSLSRRAVLGTLGTAGAVSVAGCGVLGAGGDGEETDGDETVQIGISIPQEGRWQDEGAQLQDGYLLATRHLNNASGPMAGSGGYEPPFPEVGEGLLGRTVELEIGDTKSTAEGATASAETLANGDVVMVTGGGSGPEGVSHQSVATETETVYMGGFTPSNRVGGGACSRYAFNEMYNPRMAAEALSVTLGEELGAESGVTFAQISPDNEFGDQLSSAVQSQFSAVGNWAQNRAESTRVGAGSYSGVIGEVLDTGPDLIVLNYTGLAGAIALRDLAKQSDSAVEVVVPIMNRKLVRNARASLDGVYGTVPWSPDFADPFSEQFKAAWESTESDLDVPSGVAHLAYVQLYQYAAAVERAGSLDAEAVISELEGHQYDVGVGQTEMRTCDHQAMRGVPVVRGRPESAHEAGDFTELLTVAEPGYSCDEPPASTCSTQ